MLGNIIQVLNHPKTKDRMNNLSYVRLLAEDKEYATYQITSLPNKLEFMPKEELEESLQNGEAYTMIVESLTNMGIAHNLFPQALDQNVHITRFTKEGAMNTFVPFYQYLSLNQNINIPLPDMVNTVENLDISQDQIKLGNLYIITSLGEQ